MPLYETIAICRAGSSGQTKKLIRHAARTIYSNGGNLRSCTILGDKIMGSSIIGKDDNKHQVGRYVQFLFDSNTESSELTMKELRSNLETLQVHTHKMNDYMKESLAYKRAASILEQPALKNEQQRKEEFLLALRDFKQGVEEVELSKIGLGHDRGEI